MNDYPAGKAEGRYIEAEVPKLPFADEAFDLALCSHYLFLYSAQLGEEFHRAAVRELCRVAREARLFPLIALDGRTSSFAEPVLSAVREFKLTATIETVPYEFQRGGNQMMRLFRNNLHRFRRSRSWNRSRRWGSAAPERL